MINLQRSNPVKTALLAFAVVSILSACQNAQVSKHIAGKQEYIGTREPFASEAIYFVMTDRFVDGDPTNNQQDQGGDYPTFNLELQGPDGRTANVGYMGGDFKGIVDNAGYISEMGFTAVWLSPIVDNPDQAFAGGEAITFGGAFKDGGKTGYHGYWADNFWQVDEHWPSDNLSFKQMTQTLRQQFGLKTVLDIVANHGTPSFAMPEDQPKFGEIYDQQGQLVADHQNLPPEQLDSNNPLHAFFRHEPDILQLSNLDDRNPLVRDYLINAYLYWIEQGADAFRIDTIKHVPHDFWKEFTDRIRAKHPGFFMFGESYNYDADFIAEHTLAQNGAVSVLDFPGQQAMVKVFSEPDSDFAELQDYLHLTGGPYANPYELATFYDNHDMPRMNASDNGFIDAHNWLFTSRGIPVVYQGSEMGFMRGTSEHQGNRNYFGQSGVQMARQHPIRQHLAAIANVRKTTPALQRGLQLNVRLAGQQAIFYRVLQTADIAQTALVLLNKSDQPADFKVADYMQAGQWQEALSGQTRQISDSLSVTVAAHGVQVWVHNAEVTGQPLAARLAKLMQQ
ncbi:alpha-amylase family glycosyl hydrolase [Neptunicella sp. SCSIO 80796]|uniref:alpha-amylase family glycosyl hydrolase n=1 Tax=Neptunicella plasticusilytica TaxID=3117012 RepID=UPI003A4E26C9